MICIHLTAIVAILGRTLIADSTLRFCILISQLLLLHLFAWAEKSLLFVPLGVAYAHLGQVLVKMAVDDYGCSFTIVILALLLFRALLVGQVIVVVRKVFFHFINMTILTINSNHENYRF